MQLGDDDPLGTVDDKRAILCHERNLAHVNILLLDVLDGLGGGFLVIDDQSDLDPERAGVRRAAQHTLVNVENGLAQ